MNAPTSAFQPTFFRWCAWLELGEAETAQESSLAGLRNPRQAAQLEDRGERNWGVAMPANRGLAVQPLENGAGWVVTTTSAATPLSGHRTQQSALEHAKRLLSDDGGGYVDLFGKDGRFRRRLSVASSQPAGIDAFRVTTPVNQDLTSRYEAISPEELGEAAAAVVAHADPEPGDERDGGELGDALEPIVVGGPQTPSGDAIKALSPWVDVIVIVAAAIGNVVGVTLINPELGGNVTAVFFSTLAWSLGIAFIVAGLILKSGPMNGYAFLGFIALSLVASTLIAGWAGLPGFTGWEQAVGSGISGFVSLIGYFATAALIAYGPLGIVLATASGALMGWRGVDLYRHFSTN